MPYADPERQKAFLKKYHAKNKAKRNRERRERYQKNIKRERATATERNRAKGHEERPKGPRRSTRLKVNSSRRWVTYEGKLYTNSQIGFSEQDLRAMIKDLREHKEKTGL